MTKEINTVILAAGKGTRIKLETPKPLLNIMGLKLVDYPIKNAIKFNEKIKSTGKLSIVTGHEKEQVENYIKSSYKNINFVHQSEQNGTGHALQCFINDTSDLSDDSMVMVLCADTPLIKASSLEKLYEKLEKNNWDAICASFTLDDPYGYGRIISKSKGFKIVEEKDATDDQRVTKEVNSGVYIIKTSYLKKYLNELNTENKSGELYLTDLFQENRNVGVYNFSYTDEFSGVNTLVQLENVEKVLRKEKNISLQLTGVTILNSEATYIDEDSFVGNATKVYPNTFIEGGSKIGENCIIEQGCTIKNSIIHDNVHVKAHSYIDSSEVHNDTKVGPMAHLRPGSQVGQGSKIGNFVELKKSTLDKNVSVSHLSYVGDAEIGSDTNIGCGFITCNYDGANKHKTKIGKNCFIGSDTQIIAPLEIGDEAYVASGSSINNDIPSGTFAIARSRQVNKEGMAKRFIKSKK